MRKLLLSVMVGSLALSPMAAQKAGDGYSVQSLLCDMSAAPLNPHKSPSTRETPAGEYKTYTRSANYFYVLMGVSISSCEGFASEIIYGADDEVFIKAPLSDDGMPTDVYMKGSLEGNVITVTFPQHFANIGGEDYELNRLEYKITNEAEEKGMYFIAEDNVITFTVESDGTVNMEESLPFSESINMPDFILGLTDKNGNWVGYGDFNQVYTPFNEVITVIPSDAEVKKALVRYNEFAAKVMDMAIADNKVYIAGFNTFNPNACIVGNIENDKAVFPAGQYIGIDDDWNSFAYFWAAKYEEVQDPYSGALRPQVIPIESLDFNWNAEEFTLTTDNTVVVNLRNEELAYIELYNAPNTSLYNPSAKPVAPMAPVFDGVDEYNPDEYYGYGKARFLLPMLDLNGNLLDTSRMYYNFFIDGVPYEFETSKYKELDENITDIPWDFTDTDDYSGYDFKAHDITHIVYFYDPSMKMLDHMALQQFYRQEDGTVLASEITYYGKPSAVSEVEADGLAKEVQYFNMQGISVAEPSDGVFVKVTRMADGTTRSSKVVCR